MMRLFRTCSLPLVLQDRPVQDPCSPICLKSQVRIFLGRFETRIFNGKKEGKPCATRSVTKYERNPEGCLIADCVFFW